MSLDTAWDDSVLVLCDGVDCGLALTTDHPNVDRAVEFAEANGWDVQSNEWAVCPECQED